MKWGNIVEEIYKVIFQGADKVLSQKLTRELMKEFDRDSDSKIAYEEFKEMMTRLCKINQHTQYSVTFRIINKNETYITLFK